MKSKLKRTLAFTSSLTMCSMTLLQFPDGTFSIPLTASAAEGIAISEENFPDDMFRSYVNDYINRNADGVLTLDEILNVSEMRVENMGIADLTGVEYFTELTYLFCYGNTLTTLDVSANTELEYLLCYDNKLTSLDVSENTELIQLTCYNNNLTALNVSANTALEYLKCNDNALTSLDVSANTALTKLYCEGNPLLSVQTSGTVSTLDADPLTTFTADTPIIRLADYGILRIESAIRADVLFLKTENTSS